MSTCKNHADSNKCARLGSLPTNGQMACGGIPNKTSTKEKTRLSLAFILDTGIEVHPRHDIATLKPCHGTAQYKQNNDMPFFRETARRQSEASNGTSTHNEKRKEKTLLSDELAKGQRSANQERTPYKPRRRSMRNGTQRSSKEGKGTIVQHNGCESHTPKVLLNGSHMLEFMHYLSSSRFIIFTLCKFHFVHSSSILLASIFSKIHE
jgi:hypothetical protein